MPALEPEDEDEEADVGLGVGMGDLPLLGVARPTDLNDPELQYWTKDPQGAVDFSGGPGASFPSQVWQNGAHFNFIANGVRVSPQAIHRSRRCLC